MARPSKYTQDMVDQICESIIEGNSLRQLCRPEGMPDRSTILRWLNDKPEFRDQYRMACQGRIECITDEIIDIADDASRDWKQVGNKRVLDRDVLRRARVQIEARKWMLSRMQLKKHHA